MIEPQLGKSWKPRTRPALTVKAGEVPPVEQRAVEGGQRSVEERVRAVGRVSDGVGEQVHLQQRLEQVAQHLAAHVDPLEALPSPLGVTLALLPTVWLPWSDLRLLLLLAWRWGKLKRSGGDPKI